MFLAMGLFLFAGARFVIDTLLDTKSWAGAFYPESSQSQLSFVSGVTLALSTTLVLCFITGFGLKRLRYWSLWTGTGASVFLLLGFPWLTPFGALGLLLLWQLPFRLNPKKRPEGYWDPERSSLVVSVASVIGFIGAIQALGIFQKYAGQMGLPAPSLGEGGLAGVFLLLICLLGLPVVIHEFGHAAAAWAAGFRIQAIRLGALTLRKRDGAYQIRLEWKHLLSGGGYVCSVPASPDGIRLKKILVVAAGPLASLASGVAFTGAFFELPGTHLAEFWYLFAICSVMGFYGFLVNLIPSGYTDGNMLWHLILRTRRGDELIACILSGRFHNDASDRRAAGDYEKELTLRREALRQLVEGGESNAVRLAHAHSQLGLAELAAGSRRAAESHFRAGLDLLAKSAGSRGVEADCRVGLHRVYHLQQRPAEAAEAYAAVRTILQKFREEPPDGVDRVTVLAGLAELQVVAGDYEPALANIEQALARLSGGRKHRHLRVLLLRFRVACQLELGHPALGLSAADEAAQNCHSGGRNGVTTLDMPVELALLGNTLWSGGQTTRAVTILTESVRTFEDRGEPNPAVRFRLVLADALRNEGRVTEAERALPIPAVLDESSRKQFLNTRGAIHQRAGRVVEALADYSELLHLTEEDPNADEFEIAIKQSSLAEAQLDAGNLEPAESLAHTAYRVLNAANHPEAAGTCITLGLIAWQKERSTSDWISLGLRILEEAPLLLRANKGRFFEEIARRLENAGLPEQASESRAAAARHWQCLGVDRQSCMAHA